MKPVRYTEAAARDLERHANMAERIRRAMLEYAVGDGAHMNQVKRLKGSNALRLRVGDFRVVFLESADEIVAIKVAPRGDVYDQ